ncbi:PQQ-binding-like beta-propeller repeat protein [Halovivax sp.]|uniref:PQQ-binding-like beta-propeller repeat protein n=1 Tax=Halovivax sp. TaxID=1935978 RepID=UPI0025B9BA86|nr:PQQ-binding-like beta-propeller repeat protein [Halovivax sp.]
MLPSTRRRSYLAAVAATGLAGCAGWLPGGDDADENTEPADRRVRRIPEPGADEWFRSTRSFANDVVAPEATPPREAPSERWSEATAEPVRSIAVADGRVYVGTRETVVAVDLADGSREWETDDGSGFLSVVDGRCYTRSEAGVTALDAETGDREWRYETDLVGRDPVEFDGTVYVPVGDGLRGLHADTGEPRWTVDGAGPHGALAIADGTVHWTTTDAHRLLELAGPEPPVERSEIPLYGYESVVRPVPPAVDDSTIALGGYEEGDRGGAPVQLLSTRGAVWSRPFERAVQTPALVEDRVLAAGYDNGSDALEESTVASFDRETLETNWETTVPEPVGPPAVADGTIYLGGSHPTERRAVTGRLFALDAETGDLRWERETDAGFAGHPLALVDDAIVLGTREGIVALE